MKQVILFFVFLWFSVGVQSHGFDYSVITFTEKENNTWSLHIRSSLDAFRKEVKQHFAKTPYATPEQFNEQLLEHIASTLKLMVKGKNIALGKGTVKLGHETSVFFKDIVIPNTANEIELTNGALKDIYRHTTKLFVAKKGSDKKSYILNKSNNFTINLSLK
jgi:hypothetical protein